MALNVKGRAADPEQLRHGQMCVEICRGRGGDHESCAGTVATAIQESVLRNMRGGDRDSAGLFQQRPSMGWGSYAQVTDPSYAINKFLDKFLSYRRQGQDWLRASHNTQRSAFSSAPAKWYGEGQAFASQFAGSGGSTSSFATGTADGSTGVQPYEFSRGDANNKENTWDCSGRLADEVQFRRFMRLGAMWYCSDDWLFKQNVIYRLDEFSPGVIKLTFDFETRGEGPAEANLQVAAKRYAFAPGDLVELQNEGPGCRKWVAARPRRSLF